jgi:glycosyltransferase involved in cell wall biosynthesis
MTDKKPASEAEQHGDFTVAICTRNRAAEVRRCLQALQACPGSSSVPILLVDNASTDETPLLAEEFPQLAGMRYVVEGETGLSYARNRALRETHTEYTVFLDDDAMPLPGWLAAVEACIQTWRPHFFGGPYRPYYLAELCDGGDAASRSVLGPSVSGHAGCTLSAGELPCRYPARSRLMQHSLKRDGLR